MTDLLTYAEAAKTLGVSYRTLQRLVEREHLRPVRLPGLRTKYILRRDLDAYVASAEPVRG